MEKLQGRIRYVEDWDGRGEHFVYEIRRKGEAWGLECAVPIREDKVSYTAVTRIREWQKLDVDFWFE